jgi:4-alpha-glucanotransferase
MFKRSAGILLHPTSVPGNFGIGDLGYEAYHWLDYLQECGCRLWQVLPLGPTGYGDSPYQCFSTFAGNPYLISPQLLLEDELISEEQAYDHPPFPGDRVDYGQVIPWKLRLLRQAYHTFLQHPQPAIEQEFLTFCTAQQDWLDDFALFMALKVFFQGCAWPEWDEPLRKREPRAMQDFHCAHPELVQEIQFQQFLFFRQWQALHKYASEKGIQIIGDVPIFVAQDSCDVWSHPELFKLHSSGKPRVVAGVPPDYFSPTGQRWGNPLYDWRAHQKSDFEWWTKRLANSLTLYDYVRLDHFRGFIACWEVPAHSPTAVKGRWVKTPGRQLFQRLQRHLGKHAELPFIAEDLGIITEEVLALREEFSLPGMRVLQFAFGDANPRNPFLPHNFAPHSVVYTGTHDNDTSAGWFASLNVQEQQFVEVYLPNIAHNPARELMRMAWSSVAVFALAPLQDVLGLGSEARMNFPGTFGQNWTWRLSTPVSSLPVEPLREMNYLYNR